MYALVLDQCLIVGHQPKSFNGLSCLFFSFFWQHLFPLAIPKLLHPFFSPFPPHSILPCSLVSFVSAAVTASQGEDTGQAAKSFEQDMALVLGKLGRLGYSSK